MTDIVLNDGSVNYTYKDRNLNAADASQYRTIGVGTIFAANASLDFKIVENTAGNIRKFMSTISVPKEQTVNGVTTIVHIVRAKLEMFVPLTATAAEITAIKTQLVDLIGETAFTNGCEGIVP